MTHNILSPDGVTISPLDFATKKLAEKFYLKWEARFKLQGYYSSNKGRISLKDLRDNCKPIEIVL